MKKRMKIVVLAVGIVALVGISVSLNATGYMCAKLGGMRYENYETGTTEYCRCDGVIQTGWSAECDYSLGAGDCREKTCSAAACCTDLP